MTADANLPLGAGREFDTIRALLARWGPLARGLGDDAAVLDVPPGSRLVVSTDTSVDRVHFRRDWLSVEEIGYRAAAAALSDLAAMGAAPLGMLIALTLSDAWRADAERIADGIAVASRDLGAPIVGGDLSRGSEMSIDVTVLGASAHPLRRSGARNGDTLWVTGRLGGPLRAIGALERGAAPAPVDRDRFAHPVPRLREGEWLAAHGATAAIDCSDGLAADASHLAVASEACIALDLDRLPLVAGATPEEGASSGEEYELIVTAPGTLDHGAFERAFGVPLTPVGHVERDAGIEAGLRVFRGGVPVPAPRGHDHFSA